MDYDGDGFGDICGDPLSPSRINSCLSELGGNNDLESTFEANFTKTLNRAISNGIMPRYINTFSDPKATELKNLINDANLVSHYQLGKDYYFSLQTYPGALTSRVTLSQYYSSISSSSIQFILANEGYLILWTPNADQISEILFLDILNGNGTAKVIYKNKDGQILTVNNARVEISIGLAIQNNTGVGVRTQLCQFFSDKYPVVTQNQLLKGNAVKLDLFEFTIDENGLLPLKSSPLKNAGLLGTNSISLHTTTTNCDTFCVPPTVAPIICGDKWNEFKIQLHNKVSDYSIPENLTKDGNYFCEANFGYISTDYLAYLTKLQITTEQNPLFITIEEFAATKLKYGNPKAPETVESYASYVSVQKQPKPKNY